MYISKTSTHATRISPAAGNPANTQPLDAVTKAMPVILYTSKQTNKQIYRHTGIRRVNFPQPTKATYSNKGEDNYKVFLKATESAHEKKGKLHRELRYLFTQKRKGLKGSTQNPCTSYALVNTRWCECVYVCVCVCVCVCMQYDRLSIRGWTQIVRFVVITAGTEAVLETQF